MSLKNIQLKYFFITPFFLFILMLYILVLLARLELGIWPEYGNPDNGVWGGFWYLQLLVLLVFILTILSVPIGLAFFIANIWYMPPLLGLYSYWLFFSGLLGLLYMYIDPGNFVNWYLD